MKHKTFSIFLIILLAVLAIVIYGLFIIPRLIQNPLIHDIASDYVGAQAMLDPDAELYPVLGGWSR